MGYRIKKKFIGNTVSTKAPTYPREDGGRFVLDGKLNQKDLGYLYEVMGHEGIEKDEKKNTDSGNGK